MDEKPISQKSSADEKSSQNSSGKELMSNSEEVTIKQTQYVKDFLAKIDQLDSKIDRLEKEKEEAKEYKPKSESKKSRFVNKKIPEFSGKEDEDYEAWQLQINTFINQFKDLDENEQMEIATMGVSGKALKVLNLPSKTVKTKEDIFSILTETFGNSRPISEVLGQLKQREKETVRNYFSRLKTQLQIRYPDTDSQLYYDNLFTVFRAGLRPNIQELLNAAFPEDEI